MLLSYIGVGGVLFKRSRTCETSAASSDDMPAEFDSEQAWRALADIVGADDTDVDQ